MNDPSKMSILHACYGVYPCIIEYMRNIHHECTERHMLHLNVGSGALISPFVATQFAQMKHFSFHYFTALGIALSTTLLLIVVYRFKTANGELLQTPFNYV